MAETAHADEALDARKMKGLPDLAVRTSQAASALAKTAAERAAAADTPSGRAAAASALAHAEECLASLIELETALLAGGDLAPMLRRIGHTLSVSAAAIESSATALELAR